MNYDSPLWLAWCAGFLEKERNFNRGDNMTVRVASHNGELVDRFHRVMGFGRSRVIPTHSGVGGDKETFEWKTESMEEALKLVDKLLPFTTRKLADRLVKLRDRILESGPWKAQQASSSNT